MANSAGPGLPGGPTVPDGPSPSAREVEGIFRREYGRAVSVLVRVFGDIDATEEAVQDAFTPAVQRWPSEEMRSAPGFAEQCRQLTEARAEFPWLAAGSVTVQQQALRDHAP